jgi:hypothetical protein
LDGVQRFQPTLDHGAVLRQTTHLL